MEPLSSSWLSDDRGKNAQMENPGNSLTVAIDVSQDGT